MTSIAVVNGPNLNTLGEREPEIYGSQTLGDVEDALKPVAASLGVTLEWFQSNHEGALVDQLQQLRGRTAGLVINAAAFTHTSVAIRDAVALLGVPTVEVHISNVHAREDFRQHSYLSDIVAGVIVGCGTQGYELAVRHLATLVHDHSG